MTEKKISFAEIVTQNQLETPKSTHGVYELPCGFIDNTGTLHTEIHLHEMTGREEDLLASNKLSPQKKINAIAANCLERIGTITDRTAFPAILTQLPIGDRVFLVIALRRTSLGDEFPVEDTCPSCSAKSNYVLDLGDLEVKKLPDPMRRVFDETLPSGKKVRFRLGVGADEEKILKIADEEKPSAMLLARTEMLDGKIPTLNDLKSLSWRDRQALRALMEEKDGGVDTSLDMTCPACGHEFQRELDLGQQGFFFPDRVQKGLKTKSST